MTAINDLVRKKDLSFMIFATGNNSFISEIVRRFQSGSVFFGQNLLVVPKILICKILGKIAIMPGSQEWLSKTKYL